jgi:hypothetical protein
MLPLGCVQRNIRAKAWAKFGNVVAGCSNSFPFFADELKLPIVALPTRSRDRAASSEPSLATFLSALANLEKIQKSP